MQDVFIGVDVPFPPPGVSVVYPGKCARAVTGLRTIIGGDTVLFQEHRGPAMFPSLLGVVHKPREIMH